MLTRSHNARAKVHVGAHTHVQLSTVRMVTQKLLKIIKTDQDYYGCEHTDIPTDASHPEPLSCHNMYTILS
jgi:hypothetical protein